MFSKRSITLFSCLLLSITSFKMLIFLGYFSGSSETNHFVVKIEVTSNATHKNTQLLGLPFEYLINTPSCLANVTAIQIITSYAGDPAPRSALRRAYPSNHLEAIGVRRVFLLASLSAKSTSEVTQSALMHESSRFHDLVQGNFYESYRNLTYKHIMGLNWAIENCPKTKYVIKMDDDIVVDMYQLMDLIRHYNFNDPPQMAGYVLNLKPERLKESKWYVTLKEYPADEYPVFLSGWLYLTTPLVVQNLLLYTDETPFFWIDDVYVTGILAAKAEVSFHNISSYFTFHPEILRCCMRKKLKCNYVAGPNGGHHKLQIGYQKHAYKCHSSFCQVLPPGKTPENTCVAERKRAPLGRGHSQVKVIKL